MSTILLAAASCFDCCGDDFAFAAVFLLKARDGSFVKRNGNSKIRNDFVGV